MADPIPVTLKATEEFSDWMCLRYGDLDVSRSEFMRQCVRIDGRTKGCCGTPCRGRSLAANLCRRCAHARKTPGKEKRLCMFTGERFTDDTPAGDCAGWMPGCRDGKREMPGGGTFRGGGKRTNFMPARCRHDVSIRSRPVDWLKRPTDRGRADCPFPQREVAEKGFHRLRRRVSRAVPPEGGGLKPQGNF